MKGDTLLANCRVHSMDEALPEAGAMVIRGGLVAFVGETGAAGLFAGPEAIRIDLHGRTVIPGFNDNHLHAVILGDHALAPDLGGLDAPAIVELLRERWVGAPADRILYAFNWDYPSCPSPRKELLDAAFPHNPVILSQFSGHGQWLNSASLGVLGISRESGDPPMGEVLRDPDGEPTGIVRGLGDTGLSRKRFARIFYDREEREERLDIALAEFRRLGLTSVQDNTWFPQPLASLARYRRDGRLTARFSCWPMGRRQWTIPAMRLAFAIGRVTGLLPPDWVALGPAKYFLDGAFSSRSASLFEPWADGTPGDRGPEPHKQRVTLERLARSGFRGTFHAIGDRAVGRFLDDFTQVAGEYPHITKQRFRIEHAQLVRRQDIARIRELGLCIAAQPSALGSPGKDTRLLGSERALGAYPYRSFLDGGVALSFGSDIPGEATSDPLLHIHYAVNREGPEAITVLEALRCYTRGSAYAEFMEDRKGTLAPGMFADFVVLSEDPLTAPPASLREISVLETWVDGNCVYRREGA